MTLRFHKKLSKPRRTLADFSEAPLNPGYLRTTEWKYRDGDGAARSFSFAKSEAALGSVVADLVSAAARRTAPSTPVTTVNIRAQYLRRFFEFLTDLPWDRGSDVRALTAQTLVDFAKSFPNYGTGSRASNCLKHIVNEALRADGLQLDPGRVVSRRPDQNASALELPEQYLKQVVDAARADATLFWTEFEALRACPTQAMTEISRIAATNDGLLPYAYGHNSNSQLRLLYCREQVNGSPHGLTRKWKRWLYATNESLLPFLILITYGLAGNIMSVIEAKRTLLKTRDDIFRGRRAIVSFLKRRSRGSISHSFKDAGRYSVPTLIRQVLAMTEPLMKHLPAHQRDRLFVVHSLHAGTRGLHRPAVAPLDTDLAAIQLRQFIRRHGIMGPDGEPLKVTLAMLRPTRINRVFRQTNSLLMAQRTANHKYLRTTLVYLKREQTMLRGRIVLADIQTELVAEHVGDSAPLPRQMVAGHSPARAPERDCADPYAAPSSRSNTVCPSWNISLTDPNLVIPPEPVFIAALLRDREAYRRARKLIDGERFRKYYAARLGILEDLVRRFESNVVLMKDAERLVRSLGPAPEIT